MDGLNYAYETTTLTANVSTTMAGLCAGFGGESWYIVNNKTRKEKMKITLTLPQTVIKPFLSAGSKYRILEGALIKDGHLYACDGHVCLKHPVSAEIKDGFEPILPLNAFPKGKNNYTVVTSEDNETLEVVEYNRKNVEVERRTVPLIRGTYPDVTKVWPSGEPVPMVDIPLSVHLLSKFKPLIDKNDGVTFEFYGKEKPVVLKHKDWIGFCMPMKRPY